MSALVLNSDHRDALQEIVNIGIGAAGAGLATVLNSFVELSVPAIRQIPSSELGAALSHGAWAGRRVSAVRQTFYNRMEGEVIVLFDSDGCRELADVLGHEGDAGAAFEQELLLAVSSILVGACLDGISSQLQARLGYSAPRILCENLPIAKVFEAHQPKADEALLIHIDFTLEARSFACQLVISMPGASLGPLRASLDDFLDSLLTEA
jgi:chemotaxis protein CheC